MAWVTMTCPSAVAEKAYSPRPPWYMAVSMSAIASAPAVGDFTDNPELAGIDLTREHLGRQRGHAVVVFQDRAGAAVGTNFGVDRDAHVQPLVAVDDVVAAAAHDRVAAVAAEDDVARRTKDGDATAPSTA